LALAPAVPWYILFILLSPYYTGILLILLRINLINFLCVPVKTRFCSI
jgi:hypothetical protein